MTILEVPFISGGLRLFSLLVFKRLGWKILGEGMRFPEKSVVVAYPHTSASDLFYALMLAFALRLKIRMVAKKELFRFGLGPVLRFLCCTPVQRGGKLGATEQLSETLKRAVGGFHLVLAPTGTRRQGAEWKTGFLHIAYLAKVPLLLATVDRKRKQCGVLMIYQLHGNSQKQDLEIIKKLYEKYLTSP